MEKRKNTRELIAELSDRFSQSLRSYDDVANESTELTEENEDEIKAVAKMIADAVKLSIGIDYILSNVLRSDEREEAYEMGRRELLREVKEEMQKNEE